MPLDLFAEARDLLVALEERQLEYAVAGALALAVHGAPRATSDIDLLVKPESLPAILEAARARGFDIVALPMLFSDGMEIQRVAKIDGEERLTLDLLLVGPRLEPVFVDRVRLVTEFGAVSVVSRDGLIQMKSWAGREQDIADIRRLRELDR